VTLVTLHVCGKKGVRHNFRVQCNSAARRRSRIDSIKYSVVRMAGCMDETVTKTFPTRACTSHHHANVLQNTLCPPMQKVSRGTFE
jgi:hypothetical protein